MTTYSGTKEFEGASFVEASLKGATLRFSDVSGVTMRSVDVDGLDIDSHDLFFGSLLVNGVDVEPLVDAEINRQFPGRELQKAQTPEGLREGWLAVQSAWQETVAGTPPNLMDAHVEDEWSLAQTLRQGHRGHARFRRSKRCGTGPSLEIGDDGSDASVGGAVVRQPEPGEY